MPVRAHSCNHGNRLHVYFMSGASTRVSSWITLSRTPTVRCCRNGLAEKQIEPQRGEGSSPGLWLLLSARQHWEPAERPDGALARRLCSRNATKYPNTEIKICLWSLHSLPPVLKSSSTKTIHCRFPFSCYPVFMLDGTTDPPPLSRQDVHGQMHVRPRVIKCDSVFLRGKTGGRGCMAESRLMKQNGISEAKRSLGEVSMLNHLGTPGFLVPRDPDQNKCFENWWIMSANYTTIYLSR